MLDITKIRHRSPINQATTKLSYVSNYADDETALETLDGDICLWGLLKYHLWQYEMYGTIPTFDSRKPEDIKLQVLFGMFAPKLDKNAEEWKASCVRNSERHKGKKDNP